MVHGSCAASCMYKRSLGRTRAWTKRVTTISLASQYTVINTYSLRNHTVNHQLHAERAHQLHHRPFQSLSQSGQHSQ
jgi:hypothetical protein